MRIQKVMDLLQCELIKLLLNKNLVLMGKSLPYFESFHSMCSAFDRFCSIKHNEGYKMNRMCCLMDV